MTRAIAKANAVKDDPDGANELSEHAKTVGRKGEELMSEAARQWSEVERNRDDARQRLFALIAKAAEPPPPPRKKTRPSKGAVERRLKAKAGRSTVKRLRGRISDD